MNNLETFDRAMREVWRTPGPVLCVGGPNHGRVVDPMFDGPILRHPEINAFGFYDHLYRVTEEMTASGRVARYMGVMHGPKRGPWLRTLWDAEAEAREALPHWWQRPLLWRRLREVRAESLP